MTKLMEDALREIAKLSLEDQNEMAGVLLDFIEQWRDSKLTEEQQAEVRRRLSDTNPVLVSMDEAFQRLDRLWQKQ